MPETAEPPSETQAIVNSSDFSISEKQSLLIEHCRAHKFVLASGPRYCVAPNTLIYTKNGLLPISDIGSAIEGQFSRIPHPVEVTCMSSSSRIVSGYATDFFNSGYGEAVRITTRMGYQLTCSTRHPVFSECNGVIGYRSADEIRTLTALGKPVWLAVLRSSKLAETDHQSIRVEWSSKGKKQPCFDLEINEDIGYILGLLVGDGGYSPVTLKAYRIGYTTSDLELIEKLKCVVESRFPNSIVKAEKRKYQYVIQSASLRAFMLQTGMAPKFSHEKFVPDFILRSPKGVVVAFLQGLFDTDGMVCKNGFARYCTTSERLGIEVQQLLLAIGVRSTRKFYSNDHKGFWLVCPKNEDNFHAAVGFRLQRKQARFHKHQAFKRALSSYPDSLIDTLKKLKANRAMRGVGKFSRKTHKHIIDAVFRRNIGLSKKRLEPIINLLHCENEVASFWIGGDVWWDKVQTCEATESELVDLCVEDFHNFVANGFINHNSTKTVGCLHCVADHAWRTDRGNIALVSVSQSAGLDSGVWEDLVNSVIPQWINTGMGMQWVRKPFIANVTKKPTCEVSNRYGNRTRIQLDSLKYEHEVEARFKNKRYSMMYVTELSNFKNRKTFSIWGECLRMLHLKENQHLFLGDTNPADEGEESWIYKAFYLMPKIEYPDYVELCRKDGLPILQERAFNVMKATTKLLEFQIEDNIFATQERIDELVARYSDDQDLYDRYILGMWKRATTDAIFAGVFRPSIHVIGDVESPSNSDPVIMIPQDSTYQLITGMDPGEAVNSAWALIEKVIRTLPNGKQISLFKILDELVIVGESHSLDDFSESVVEKMHWWQEHCGRNFEFSHWSDRSVFDMKEPRELKYYHQIIYEASGGEILLRAADRGAGTVRKRVALFRKLLFENRVFFNNAKCPMGIEMCRAMRKGPTETQVIAKGSKHKHIFDAITYAIASESYDEMEDMVWNSLKIKTTTNEPTLISIPA